MLECRDLVHLLSDYVNDDVDPLVREQFDHHLSRCPRCKVIVNTLRETILLCGELKPVKMPVQVHHNLRVTIRKRWASKRTSFKRPASKGVEMKRKEGREMPRREYHPLAEFSRMDSVFDQLMARFFSDFLPRRWRGEWPLEMRWTPVVDVIDKKSHFLLRADLPGLKKEDVRISISDDNLLTISGETKQSGEEKRGDYYRCERCYGQFSRTVQLPMEVIPDKVEATLKDGILEIKLPKREAKKAKELEIEVK